MSVGTLLDKYKNSPRLFQLADRLSFSGPQKIRLQNLNGSASQFVAAGIFLHPSCGQLNHVFICNDDFFLFCLYILHSSTFYIYHVLVWTKCMFLTRNKSNFSRFSVASFRQITVSCTYKHYIYPVPPVTYVQA